MSILKILKRRFFYSKPAIIFIFASVAAPAIGTVLSMTVGIAALCAMGIALGLKFLADTYFKLSRSLP